MPRPAKKSGKLVSKKCNLKKHSEDVKKLRSWRDEQIRSIGGFYPERAKSFFEDHLRDSTVRAKDGDCKTANFKLQWLKDITKSFVSCDVSKARKRINLARSEVNNLKGEWRLGTVNRSLRQLDKAEELLRKGRCHEARETAIDISLKVGKHNSRYDD